MRNHLNFNGLYCLCACKNGKSHFWSNEPPRDTVASKCGEHTTMKTPTCTRVHSTMHAHTEVRSANKLFFQVTPLRVASVICPSSVDGVSRAKDYLIICLHSPVCCRICTVSLCRTVEQDTQYETCSPPLADYPLGRRVWQITPRPTIRKLVEAATL